MLALRQKSEPTNLLCSAPVALHFLLRRKKRNRGSEHFQYHKAADRLGAKPSLMQSQRSLGQFLPLPIRYLAILEAA